MYFERSGTRKWNLPPSSYAQSSLPAALSRVNTLLMSDWQHSNQANLKQDQSTVINDQILIKVNKLSDSEESPTPEGVHQDGTEVSSVTMIERKGIQVGAPRHASPAPIHTDCSHTRCVQLVAACCASHHGPPRTHTSTKLARNPRVPCRPHRATLCDPPVHSTAERAGSGARTRRRATMTGSAQMANQSCRQRASAGAIASPTSPSSSRGRASSSSIARSVCAPAACCDPPSKAHDHVPCRSSLTQLLLYRPQASPLFAADARLPSPTPARAACATVHR